MKKWIMQVTFLMAMVLTLMACGGALPSEGNAGPKGTGDEATAVPILPTLTAETPTEPVEEPVDSSAPPEAAVDTRVQDFVAQEMGVAAESVLVLAKESREWPSSALGCPQPGMGYADVITPGYQFKVEVNGESLAVHTDQMGDAIIVCQEGTEAMDGGEDSQVAMETDAAVERAVSFLATETGLDPATITLTNVSSVEWSDSSLGCPDPATMYMQVLTEGFQIVLEHDGETFYVHTNSDGSNIVLCENPQAPAPGTDK